MKPRLLILSDLFGFQNSTWIQYYINDLESIYDIALYDALELAAIDPTDLLENEIHQQFVHDGIEKAVNKLFKLEKNPVDVLAFSIGGTIAWKAGLQGLPIKKMVAVSSTRLRKEIMKPNCSIELFFAEDDMYVPNEKWFTDLGISPKVIDKASHDFYISTHNINLISSSFVVPKLIETYVTSRVVLVTELALGKLKIYTNRYNFEYIIESISMNAKSSEMDVSMYILEISNLKYSQLAKIILELKKTYKERDAIEDLDESLQNLSL